MHLKMPNSNGFPTQAKTSQKFTAKEKPPSREHESDSDGDSAALLVQKTKKAKTKDADERKVRMVAF